MTTATKPHPARNGHPMLALVATLFLFAAIFTTIWRVGLNLEWFADNADVSSWVFSGWEATLFALISVIFWAENDKYANRHGADTGKPENSPDAPIIICSLLSIAWFVFSIIWMVGYSFWFYWPAIIKFFGG